MQVRIVEVLKQLDESRQHAAARWKLDECDMPADGIDAEVQTTEPTQTDCI